jgi:hypothetical protein
MIDFHSTHVFSVKKADNRANFEAGGIINCITHQNSLCRGKTKHQVISYVMIYKAMSHVTLPRMSKLSPAPTLVASSKRRLPSK